MRITARFTLILSSLVVFSVAAKATDEIQNVEINWQNPEKYTDIDGANESNKRFRERTIKQLTSHISDLAATLPDGQSLTITVTDVDLAGQVWPASFVGMGNSGSEIRLIKDVYIPRMELHYTLHDNTGAVVMEDDVKLKDMAFNHKLNRYFDDESLRYEKAMLDAWFKDTFTTMAKN
ncbi:DUF3016 domain-containing protein [Aestuariibacter sp. AA17]|uniref:DUF3016 domain-containing protein n=1 Tax=Fluctibacter corallii TaxID=2984329 RepID=A0ABT3A7Y8_9ALTE|nr:DUF3016 domain-containing protein [Aestuariibacter sp. AA17]MCV2884786.1 DUF3016 domain-containing protein [Aestuariibacter sp. AA17]